MLIARGWLCDYATVLKGMKCSNQQGQQSKWILGRTLNLHALRLTFELFEPKYLPSVNLRNLLLLEQFVVTYDGVCDSSFFSSNRQTRTLIEARECLKWGWKQLLVELLLLCNFNGFQNGMV